MAVMQPWRHRRWTGIVSFVVAVGVAAAAALGIAALQKDATNHRHIKYLLSQISTDTYNAMQLQQEATIAGVLSPGRERELRLALNDAQSKLEAIDDIHSENDVALDAAFAEFRDELQRELPALRAGSIGLATLLDAFKVDPAFAALAKELHTETLRQDAHTQRADRAAARGSAALLALAVLVVTGLVCLNRRGARKRQHALAESERRFRAMIQHGSDMIAVVGPDMRSTYSSPSIERTLGDLSDEDGRWSANVVHPDDRDLVSRRLGELAREAPGFSVSLAYRVRHIDGSFRFVEAIATNLLAEPSVNGIVLNLRDVTERAELQEQLSHRALHDPLTDLANRALFNDRLEHALDRAGRGRDHTAVALLDLDNFKAVNDSLGHGVGDDLLVIVADRLATCMRPGDTVARLGGDEFVVLLEATYEIEAVAVAERMLAELVKPVVLSGRPIVIQGSIGVATSREAPDATSLMRNADLAMYAAKSAGRGRTEVFHAGMHETVAARMELEADLRRALDHAVDGGQLRLHYQPQVSLATGRITGFEALVRWQHPERGTIPPLEFIPIAEETGLIVSVGAWVLGEACRQSVAWRDAIPNGDRLAMSVNVSGRQFEAGLISTVEQVLAETGMDPGLLCLEVTESIVMHDVELAIATIRDLKALGVRLSIDDFGTGYSSLGYLQQFALDELKVDKSFVEGLGLDSNDGAIVAAVMALARALDLTVVAEGVETKDQAERLDEMGCETGQGYYFARPKTAAEITELLEAERLPAQVHTAACTSLAVGAP